MSRRVIQLDKNLYFDYEVVPHRRIQQRIDSISAARLNVEDLPQAAEEGADDEAPSERRMVTGRHIRFKQVGLTGQINPLKPPIHVESVLIDRALGQPTGTSVYLGWVFECVTTAMSRANF